MAHMQPDISHDSYFEVETDIGTEIVPGDVIGRTGFVRAGDFAQYLEGEVSEPDDMIESKIGYLARLSAPGYLDCTDWTAHESEKEAQDYLRDTYGVFFGNEPTEELIAECDSLGFDIVHDENAETFYYTAREYADISETFETDREAALACIARNAG